MRDLPPFELGYPRTELRRQLVDAVLRGDKTATAGLLEDYEAEGERSGRCPAPAARCLGYDDEPVAVVEVTESRVLPAAEVDNSSPATKAKASSRSRNGASRTSTSSSARLTPDTQIVAVRFRVVEQL